MTDEEILAWARAIGLTWEVVLKPDGSWWTARLRLEGREMLYGGAFGAGIPKTDEAVLPSVLGAMASTRRAANTSLEAYIAEDPDEPARDRDWYYEQEQVLKDREFLGAHYDGLENIIPLY